MVARGLIYSWNWQTDWVCKFRKWKEPILIGRLRCLRQHMSKLPRVMRKHKSDVVTGRHTPVQLFGSKTNTVNMWFTTPSVHVRWNLSAHSCLLSLSNGVYCDHTLFAAGWLNFINFERNCHHFHRSLVNLIPPQTLSTINLLTTLKCTCVVYFSVNVNAHDEHHFYCLFWSVSGPPVGVGMNIDIASIDMVSEVNMVSRPLLHLLLKLLAICGLMIPAMHIPTRGNTLSYRRGNPSYCRSANL